MLQAVNRDQLVKERNEKIESIWKRAFEGRTICTDLPRFVHSIKVYKDGQAIFASEQSSKASKSTSQLLCDLISSLVTHLESPVKGAAIEDQFFNYFKNNDDLQNKPLFVKYLTEQFNGEEGIVVRCLQTCTQSVPSPAIIELQKTLISASGQRGMTKDVKDSWFFHIFLPPHKSSSLPCKGYITHFIPLPLPCKQFAGRGGVQ